MHEWTHAERDGHCGGCDKPITEGEPIRLTSIQGVRRRLMRCQDCVGAAPPELPNFVARATETVSFVPLQAASPERTRGGLKRAAEWMPYRDE